VVELWRYPVRSMQGEPLHQCAVTERGIPGDRAYALVETASGKVASAKSPRKWGRLLQWRASFLAEPQTGGPVPPVKIVLPDGRELSSADRDIDAALSAELGCGVSLRSSSGPSPVYEESPLEGPLSSRTQTLKTEPLALGAPTGTFFDFAPIHIVTRETLERLASAHPDGRFAVSRLRPNVVVTAARGATPFAETAWVGTTVSTAAALQLNIVMPTPRCVMTTLPHGDLPQDPSILLTVAEHSKAMIAPLRKEMPSVGVYALVEQQGTLRIGDELRARKTTLIRRSAFWWTLASNLVRRKLPAAGGRSS